jgi:predicted ferric reductase
MYLAIPELSWLQWHPFSLSSSPNQKVVTLHIRKMGNWTKALYELSENKKHVDILLEGPYGNLSVDIMGDRKYKNVMLISGGIGSKLLVGSMLEIFDCVDSLVWKLDYLCLETVLTSYPSDLFSTMQLHPCNPFVISFSTKRPKAHASCTVSSSSGLKETQFCCKKQISSEE